jgi:hypothetical protein
MGHPGVGQLIGPPAPRLKAKVLTAVYVIQKGCDLSIYRFRLWEYIYIYWSKPGSINAPQKQDENRGFGPGQAAGRTPGKLGGNMPVKLAKIRGKKEQQTE